PDGAAGRRLPHRHPQGPGPGPVAGDPRPQGAGGVRGRPAGHRRGGRDPDSTWLVVRCPSSVVSCDEPRTADNGPRTRDMSIRHSRLEEIVRRDPRYPYEAYDFVLTALEYTQKRLNRASKERGPAAPDPRQQDVSALEWLEGVRQLALREFGLMARTVF